MIANPMDNKRIKIGIIFNFSSSWMGGVNYIINVIKMLNFLDDVKKPELTVFYNPALKMYIDELNYPYLKSVKWHFPSVFKGYLRSWASGRNVFVNDILSSYDLDGLYPLHDFPVRTNSKTKLVSWYADLQHIYYPEFFTKRKVLERTLRIRFILKNSNDLVVSSNEVAKDFNKFFRIRNNLDVHVFHFASVIGNISGMSIEEIRYKYSLPLKYFMVSNQFYKHKNHKVLLQALSILRKKGTKIYFIFTGRLPEKSNSAYLTELHQLINRNKLHDQISFLGVIPRNEQLLLMKYSQAVIQPTLFEGWSTVIEDAISLQVPVVASNLPVNIEQLGESGIFFDPYNPIELATILDNFPERNFKDIFYEGYTQRLKRAADQFLKIFL